MTKLNNNDANNQQLELNDNADFIDEAGTELFDEDEFDSEQDAPATTEVTTEVATEVATSEATATTLAAEELAPAEDRSASCDQFRQHLNNVSFKVTAEAGQLLLSLEGLQKLRIGDILDLAELPPQVTLMLNGLVLGHGYLVEINNRVGVKLISLNANSK